MRLHDNKKTLDSFGIREGQETRKNVAESKHFCSLGANYLICLLLSSILLGCS